MVRHARSGQKTRDEVKRCCQSPGKTMIKDERIKVPNNQIIRWSKPNSIEEGIRKNNNIVHNIPPHNTYGGGGGGGSCNDF
jgi:hypothetical protein